MVYEGCKYLVVGAGVWGAVLAERITAVYDERVVVIDRRAHSGGNCHSYIHPDAGIECHAYGTHIFHTKKESVWNYISSFVQFNNYRHKVLTEYKGRIFTMPIGLGTVNALYGLSLKPFEMEAFIRKEAAKEGIQNPKNLEEKALSLVGRPLYEALIKGYTRKQWNRSPAELPAEIITRLPVRSNYNFDYFDDPWQGLPVCGYYGLFAALLQNDKITLRLGVDYKDIASLLPADCRIFYSGAIDEFFDFRLGALEWRSLRFEEDLPACPDYQGAAVVNQADEEVPFTRTHEFRHLHPERPYTDQRTVIVREYPHNFTPGGTPYYPVNTPANQSLLQKYQDLASTTFPAIIFGGRLGSYRYLDMDAAMEQALYCFQAFNQEQGKRSS